MSYQSDQSSGLIFNRYVPDVPPVHYAGGEIDQVLGLDGEQVSRHELTNSTIAVFPSFRLRVCEYGPTMDRVTFLLVCKHCGGQFSAAGVFRTGVDRKSTRLNSSHVSE